MLALVAAPGRPEGVELREVPDPVPTPQETLVEVRAVSLNRGEVNRLTSAPDGALYGWDLAGAVIQAAADGTGPAPGARVAGFVPVGAWAQRAAVPASRLAVIPDGVSYAAASAVPVAGLTALRTLRHGGLLLQKRVLITGASGGVGRFAVQLAALGGAEVTAIAGNSERASGLSELGAARVVQSIDDAGEGFDLILESVGGASLATALRSVRPRGTVVTFGNSSREQTTFDVSTFYGKAPRLVGFSLLQAWEQEGLSADLGVILGLIAADALDPHIGLQQSWRDAPDAMAALRDRRVQGKAVLRIE